MLENEISVIYGDDPAKMCTRLLNATDLHSHIKPDARVLIKPQLSRSMTHQDGVTTHPQIVVATIAYLRKLGVGNIYIFCSCDVGYDIDEIAYYCGYQIVSTYTGVPLICADKANYAPITSGGVSLAVPTIAMQADIIINIPVLHADSVFSVTGAVSNLYDMLTEKLRRTIPPSQRTRYISELYKLLPQQFVITDSICGDIESEYGLSPFPTGIIYCSHDPYLADAYGCRLFAHTPNEIPTLANWYENNKNRQPEICELGDYQKDFPYIDKFFVSKLARYVVQNGACRGCYNSVYHALARLQAQGLLQTLREKIHIGTGYRDMYADKLSVGNCCRDFSCNISGCAPLATDVYQKLSTMLQNS